MNRGIAILQDPKVFGRAAKSAERVFSLPPLLRFVRSPENDNAILGVRSATNMETFQKALAEFLTDPDASLVSLINIDPKDFWLISRSKRVTWVATHPDSRFFAALNQGIYTLCPFPSGKVTALLNKEQAARVEDLRFVSLF